MSGIGKGYRDFALTGNTILDQVLVGRAWADNAITYSFPQAASDYLDTYGDPLNQGSFPDTFSAVTPEQATAMRRLLDRDVGPIQAAAFRLEGLINLSFSEVTESADVSAHIRAGNTQTANFAFGYYPGTGYDEAGDIWFDDVYNGNTTYDLRFPDVGNYAFMTMAHELCHAMGLDHTHSGSVVASDFFDQIQFSIMSYKSFEGQGLNDGYQSEKWGFAQTFMMVDIAALQAMYGADFTTNAGDTTYRWAPDSGVTYIDGVEALTPGANRIFATLWDGDGNDTYDLSAYSTGLNIDLAPGSASAFDAGQLANLGGGNFAIGNIYNPYLYQDDTRSLIENVIGGNGNDTMAGNQAANLLRGQVGADTLSGLAGNDLLIGDIVATVRPDTVESAVYRAYQAVFDRAPDLDGFNAFAREIRLGNLTVETMITDFVASEEFQNTYGDLGNRAFVEQLYRNVLNRDGDPDGVNAFTAAIEGGRSRESVVIQFASEGEFLRLIQNDQAAFFTNVTIDPAEGQVFRIYQAVFGRAPDEGGFTNFVNAIQGEALNLSNIAAEFVASTEFQNTYGELSNEEFVNLLYTNVLPGNTDAQGRADFTAALDNNTLTRVAIVQEFSESSEFRARTDMDALAFVGSIYAGANDVLAGGVGDDILFGGRGADQFQFNSDSDGADRVLDFQTGKDLISLNDNASFDSFDEVIAAATQVGADTVIDFGGGNSLTLVNVTLGNLSASDFEFVNRTSGEVKLSRVEIAAEEYAARLEAVYDIALQDGLATFDASGHFAQETGYWEIA